MLARVPKVSLQAPRGTDFDAEFTAAYLRHISSTLDKITLLALGRHEQPKLSLTTAYLSLSVSRKPTRRAEKELSAWSAGPSAVRAEVAIGSADRPRVVVLGEAGSGKSTLLDWLAVTAARSEFTDQLAEWNGIVPFVIRLRSFPAGSLPAPEDFIRHVWPMNAARMPEGWVHRHFEEGTAVVLIDGVDEVGADRRQEVHTWIGQLVAQNPELRLVVTSRPAAIGERWLNDEGFSDVNLLPMNADDISQFIRRWHEAAERSSILPCDHSELPAAEQRLHNQLATRPYLRTLASTPLLCAMLCALNLDHSTELPHSRMELYRRALTMLLDIRDAKRKIPGILDLSQKEALLGDLAWRLTEGGLVEMTEQEAQHYIELKLPSMPNVDKRADEILQHLLVRTGVLRRPEPGTVDFVHRTFLEYLAASEATEQARIPALVASAHLDTWRETIVMACGHAKRNQVDDLLARILDRADREPENARKLWLLAAACLETVNQISPELRERIDSLIRQHLVPPRYREVAELLARMGHRLLRYLPSTLDGLTEEAAAATVQAAGQTRNTEALRYLSNYAQDPRSGVQDELVHAWQYFDPRRYAEEVLADAPLHAGVVVLGSTNLLPYVGILRHLRGLILSPGAWETVDSLDLLDGVPCLHSVGLRCRGDVDVTPVSRHPDVESILLVGAREYLGARSLGILPKLRRLSLLGNMAWSDLEFLRGLQGLRRLSLGALQEINDYSPLDDLTQLSTVRLSQVGDLREVAGGPWPQVKDLSVVDYLGDDVVAAVAANFPRIQTLALRDQRTVDLSDLGQLPVEKLILDHCQAVNLSGITATSTLREIWLTECSDVDLRPLVGEKLELHLSRRSTYQGIDELGPGVALEWIG
ncbi:NACHT domain-containing protein [Kibdelosporangium aridum]|uniref:NACHT domain-containing protein n=1 Tax=Kibdelosporangium aridum TaxID=2030 RepID=A0A428ZS15_KIBAR|nr:NACHT domain-containing protein [Kibdelosporangium aridum]RSM90773.1 NACHT domain-containing protein [Kibdelosporangium aridum]